MFTFYQPWAIACGFKQVSGFLAGFAGCAMAVRVGLGGIADRLGRLRVAKAMLLLYIFAPLSLIWLPQVGLLISGGLLGISHGMFFPSFNAVALDYTPERERKQLLRSVFLAKGLIWSSDVYPFYTEWANQRSGNRYEKIMGFAKEMAFLF
jgi:MFS family permease